MKIFNREVKIKFESIFSRHIDRNKDMLTTKILFSIRPIKLQFTMRHRFSSYSRHDNISILIGLFLFRLEIIIEGDLKN